ncbi:restriction endonuclease subunit S [Slackia faecicanis]|uniref:Restriction endonuclease subunit S n=1 Tax=Slackia faecicanis TaxID=255723 RepID=A0A3N0AF20_9ACTN|nr:restriction endonuclease subunit S [Slackia faecicanis]
MAPKKDAFSKDGVSFVRAGSLSDLLAGGSLADLEKIDAFTAEKLRLTLFPAGTVVFAKSGMSCMTGNVYILPEPCYVVSHLACVIPNGSHAVYLKHYFRFNRPNKFVDNPSFPSIKLNRIKNIELRLPLPGVMDEQARVLERIEGQVEQMKMQLSLLDALVKSRFVEMFGNSRLGYKYEIQKLGALLSVDSQNGLYKPQKFYVDKGGVPIVRVDAFQTGHIDDYGSLKRLECSESEIEVYGLRENDIVINRVNGSIERVGKIAWIHGLAEPTVFESNLMRFHVDEDKLDLSYITAFLNSDDIRQQIKSRARIANQCSINQGNVADFDIPLPPLALQQEFADFVAQVDKSRFVAQLLMGKYNGAMTAIEKLITR